MSDRSQEELERDAERIRNGIADTAEKLSHRMSPGQMVDEVTRYLRGSDSSIALDKMKRQIRENPVALALVGAGLAWLMVGGRSGHHYGERYGESGLEQEPGDAYRSGASKEHRLGGTGAPGSVEVGSVARAERGIRASAGVYGGGSSAELALSPAAKRITSHVRSWAGKRHTGFDAERVVREVEAFDRGQLQHFQAYSPAQVRMGLTGIEATAASSPGDTTPTGASSPGSPAPTARA